MTTETSNSDQIDTSIYLYQIPSFVQFLINLNLNKNDAWIDAARMMGYIEKDIKDFQQYANVEGKSPSEVLISYWSDQGNHTVLELFMILYQVKHYAAMDCLKRLVDKKYHRLILLNQPNFNDGHNELPSRADEPNINVQNEVESEVAGIPHVQYADLVKATSGWDESLKLGRGGFACVYRGMLKNSEYAIKRIKYQGSNHGSRSLADIEKKQSLNELRCLNLCRHDNVLPLYFHSYDGRERCLVYQYMAGGSLEGRLHVKGDQIKVLTFEERRLIAVGTARGLQYLHTFDVKPLIHGDIKPANILLDNFGNPKIGDFGLAREGSMESTKVSKAYGTAPYVAQELLKHYTLSTKVDTYSYGVVLFEMFTGLRACLQKRENAPRIYLVHYMWSFEHNLESAKKSIDSKMEVSDVIIDLFLEICRIALECTRPDPDDRPEMAVVLAYLESKINNVVIE